MGKFAQKIIERSQAVQPKRIEVPELGDGGKPLVVYMHPLTLQERSQILPLAVKNDLTALAKMVRFSARDEDGEHVFDLEDEKMMVRSKDLDWLIRLSGAVSDDMIPAAETLGES